MGLISQKNKSSYNGNFFGLMGSLKLFEFPTDASYLDFSGLFAPLVAFFFAMGLVLFLRTHLWFFAPARGKSTLFFCTAPVRFLGVLFFPFPFATTAIAARLTYLALLLIFWDFAAGFGSVSTFGQMLSLFGAFLLLFFAGCTRKHAFGRRGFFIAFAGKLTRKAFSFVTKLLAFGVAWFVQFAIALSAFADGDSGASSADSTGGYGRLIVLGTAAAAAVGGLAYLYFFGRRPQATPPVEPTEAPAPAPQPTAPAASAGNSSSHSATVFPRTARYHHFPKPASSERLGAPAPVPSGHSTQPTVHSLPDLHQKFPFWFRPGVEPGVPTAEARREFLAHWRPNTPSFPLRGHSPDQLLAFFAQQPQLITVACGLSLVLPPLVYYHVVAWQRGISVDRAIEANYEASEAGAGETGEAKEATPINAAKQAAKAAYDAIATRTLPIAARATAAARTAYIKTFATAFASSLSAESITVGITSDAAFAAARRSPTVAAAATVEAQKLSSAAAKASLKNSFSIHTYSVNKEEIEK